MNCTVESLLAQYYDCIIFASSQVQILDEISEKIQSLGVKHFNLSKELSSVLMAVLPAERCKFAQDWLKELVSGLQEEPILFSTPDLLFHPSLEIDFFSLIRQVARLKQIIVLWLGEYSASTLTYAMPDHHHYRVWKISDSLLLQPKIFIYQISAT